jgi:hypothetical protein
MGKTKKSPGLYESYPLSSHFAETFRHGDQQLISNLNDYFPGVTRADDIFINTHVPIHVRWMMSGPFNSVILPLRSEQQDVRRYKGGIIPRYCRELRDAASMSYCAHHARNEQIQ